MKKSSNSISPFLILLIPALLIIGYKNTQSTEIEPERKQASIHFQMPSLKGFIKAIF